MDSVSPQNSKLVVGWPPVHAAIPFCRDVSHNKIEELERGFLARKGASGFDDLAKGTVQRFHGIGGVNDLPNLRWESEEWNHVLPVPFPQRSYGAVLLVPFLSESHQFLLCRVRGGGTVDGSEVRHHVFAILPVHKLQAIANQMHDAGLNLRFGKDALNRFRKTFEAVYARNKDVLDAAIPKFRHDCQPELRTLAIGRPQT